MKTAWIAAAVLLAACSGSSSAAQPSPSPRTPGPLDDTWTGNGTTWQQAKVPGPSPRYSASLAYDTQRHVYVLFGGQTTQGSSDETWTWDESKWTAMTPAHKPPPRRSAAMAYDPAHQVVVLYGGLVQDKNEGFAASDTWTWDGADWTLISAKTSAPGDREGPQMVTAGDRVVLVGGRYYNLKYYADAWTWDGRTWSRLDRNPTPPGRSGADLTWNPVGSFLFVYGGMGIRSDAGPGALGTPLGDAWSLKNGVWTQLTAAGTPTRANANTIWDQRSQRAVILFGVRCPNPTKEAWAWDGTSWAQAANLPISARWGAAVAQDPDGKVLVFGGSDEPGC